MVANELLPLTDRQNELLSQIIDAMLEFRTMPMGKDQWALFFRADQAFSFLAATRSPESYFLDISKPTTLHQTVLFDPTPVLVYDPRGENIPEGGKVATLEDVTAFSETSKRKMEGGDDAG